MRQHGTGDDGDVKNQQTPPPPWHPLAWADALTQFGRTEVAGGVILTIALAAALVWANLDAHSYGAVWLHQVTRSPQHVPGSLHLVVDGIDNGLMTVFFLAVGLEIGREVAEGSLSDWRNALLPVVSALGGMLGAALLYVLMVVLLRPHGGVATIAKGWGIPMATDVAFTLAAISLLGRRVPRPLRIFVLALAVADDVASVVVLAFVASTTLHLLWLMGALAALGATCLLRLWVRHPWWPYVVAAVVVWYLCVRGGIEATLAGAFVGILVPVAGGARAGRTLERPVHALSSFVVLPLFVLANAGVVLSGAVWHSSGGVSVLAAIFVARTVGKFLGIILVVVLAVRLGLSNLPEETTWRHIVGVSLLCGMGLTVPLLFAHAIFGSSPLLYSGAQIGLLLGTLGAALLGGIVLLTGRRALPRRASPAPLASARATVPAADTPPAPSGDGNNGKES
jgi:Na+:H+ antiporter, NhaA family